MRVLYQTQVGTNGYFTFTDFVDYRPFLFNENTTLPIVAPFFTDINIASGVGTIYYETHTTATSEYILYGVDSVINEQAETDFYGEWMLVATWSGVPPFGDTSVVSLYLLLAAPPVLSSFTPFHRETPSKGY